MKTAIKISIFLAAIIAAMLVKCHDELTFLKDVQDIPAFNDLVFVDSENDKLEKTSNLKGLEVTTAAAVPDYDMYVLSIQWGSKIIFYFFI